MRLSPIDIRQQQFTVRMFRGLDPPEVDAFLEDVAEDYEALLRESTLLKEQLTAYEERARGAGDVERTLKETLVTTQKLAEEMKAAGRREAELAVREAQLQGEKLLAEARAEEATLRTEISGLKRTRRQLLEDVRATLDRYQRFVAEDLKRDGDGAR
ncbi:MAG: DivIVA domain-containing protein [Candidatus Rokubacteria bacterium]|nr:DivIVA domain-containing protein [Candidatus Rokubacteria bacterium]